METIAPDQQFNRIYVGSLDYNAKPADIEELLHESNLDDFEKIHLKVDPISGRNPGYCFVQFPSYELAAGALDQLAGKSLLGRNLKLGPCYPTGSSQQTSRASSDYRPASQRWGDRRGQNVDNAENQASYGSAAQFDRHKVNDGTRVRVEGLPDIADQDQNDAEIRDIFAGFDVVAIGKRAIPYSLRGTPGNHHHCYVDFGSKEEAQRAAKEADGKDFGDSILKVSVARPSNRYQGGQNRDQDSQAQPSGERGFGRGRQQGTDRAERNERGKTIMEASSWRRAA
ncbi:hypothetical protein QBC42DRAFT_345950 [Cladorrhinum samala]|uniref:RRM domain-containing protein n=1 Tax=Cladorrhinum samala TaxID=585594 RepID=A0AAV9HQ02_9PEZI|nr:hypothetical protein QBC42DRAFT_345950 [Cladorrhinum samala]